MFLADFRTHVDVSAGAVDRRRCRDGRGGRGEARSSQEGKETGRSGTRRRCETKEKPCSDGGRETMDSKWN